MEQRFYWLKLKKDFFKRHDIKIIESMPNGKDYILFYLKLLCESVDHEGNLRFSDQIPYNEDMLSVITNTNVDIVRSAIKIFSQLNMMEILDDGTYFMNEVNKMLGSESASAERVRKHRENKKMLQCNDDVTKCNIEIDIDKEKELEKELDNKKKNKEKNQDGILPPDVSISKHKYGEYGWVKLTDAQYSKLTDEFGKDYVEQVISALDEYVQSNGNKNKYKDFNLVIRKAIREKWFKIDDFTSGNNNEIVWEEAKASTLEEDIEFYKKYPQALSQALKSMDEYDPERAKAIREALKVGN